MQLQENKIIPTPREILLKEYESLVTQFVHWDSLFWSKSQFFLLIQSAFIAIFLQAFKENVTPSQTNFPPRLLCLFLLIALFNIYLCCVWFITNRRNREYLQQRAERAIQIESDLKVLRTFTDGRNLPKGHRSSNLETHLPTAFIIAWVVLMALVVLPR
jgi:hypothetical protein